MVGQINNQALGPGPAHDQRCVRMIFEGTFIKIEVNFCSCRPSAKKTCNLVKDYMIRLSIGGT